MPTETRRLIEAKLLKGEPLTLDERVYRYESVKMDKFRSGTEPFWKKAQDVIDFYAKFNRVVTPEEIAKWLDEEGAA